MFTESATEREVNAVNSENDKNLKNDFWRIMQLEKSTADPNHDYSKFGTGLFTYFVKTHFQSFHLCSLSLGVFSKTQVVLGVVCRVPWHYEIPICMCGEHNSVSHI